MGEIQVLKNSIESAKATGGEAVEIALRKEQLEAEKAAAEKQLEESKDEVSILEI